METNKYEAINVIEKSAESNIRAVLFDGSITGAMFLEETFGADCTVLYSFKDKYVRIDDSYTSFDGETLGKDEWLVVMYDEDSGNIQEVEGMSKSEFNGKYKKVK